MQHISPQQLKAKRNAGIPLQLLDVREPHEHEAFNIGGILLPLSELMQRSGEIPAQGEVIVYCKKGIRSQIAIQRLQDKFGYTHLINLSGGMEAWKREFGV
jgi:rhodanese-related sulfurtransferase